MNKQSRGENERREANSWVKWRFDKWRADEGLRMCGLAAKGLWIELLSIMYGCDPCGHLAFKGAPPTPKQIAKMVGNTTEKEVGALLQELEDAGVFSRTADTKMIYCRRMVRDKAIRDLGRSYGLTGGNPVLTKPESEDEETLLTGGVNPDSEEAIREPYKIESETESDTETESESEITRAVKLTQPALEGAAIWNRLKSPNAPEVQRMKQQRRGKFLARLADELGGKMENWESFCRRVASSAFLTGSNGFVATFDWVLEPKNMLKVMEGNYDNRKPTTPHVNGKPSNDAAIAALWATEPPPEFDLDMTPGGQFR